MTSVLQCDWGSCERIMPMEKRHLWLTLEGFQNRILHFCTVGHLVDWTLFSTNEGIRTRGEIAEAHPGQVIVAVEVTANGEPLWRSDERVIDIGDTYALMQMSEPVPPGAFTVPFATLLRESDEIRIVTRAVI